MLSSRLADKIDLLKRNQVYTKTVLDNLVPRVSLLPTSLALQGVGRRETLGTRLGA